MSKNFLCSENQFSLYCAGYWKVVDSFISRYYYSVVPGNTRKQRQKEEKDHCYGIVGQMAVQEKNEKKNLLQKKINYEKIMLNTMLCYRWLHFSLRLLTLHYC